MKKNTKHIGFQNAKSFLFIKKKIKYIGLLILFISFSAVAQKPMVKAEIDTTNIRIGEQFNLKISVNEINNVIIPKLQLKGLEVVDSSKVDTLKNSLVKRYVLTGFDSGAFYIPKQHIYIKNQDFTTDSLLINVATIAIDTTQVKKFPIKAIKSEPIVFDDYQNYVWMGILLLIIIGLLLYFFVFKKKKEEIVEEVIPALPPFEEAIEKLQELDEKLLWQNNKIKEYYSELTDIVRNYIGRDIEIPTIEQTSNEIIELIKDQNQIKNLELSKETIDTIKSLLMNADLVKFAKSKPLSNEIEDDRKAAELIIKKIQPKVTKYKAAILAKDSETKTETDDVE